MNTLSEGFVLALVASGSACVAFILKCLLKSRCSTISFCWGLWKCDRDTLPADTLTRMEMASPSSPMSVVNTTSSRT